ncbi:uncharacterized protein F4822DRAFT_136215 [Hypoxylon trugodes]|uniref:uncharacterized protein n=1 Tax=Hypoxylon trugodes TaxID=326681 RepID=UPI00218DC57B|nr:uncharacterized protein F4822DRAFT_136215 [Hypoxylon trugodes]KAI1392643.1 hypothetical protein F4822DRAFT_136215 [Hypoxylon trugodes]
MSEPRSKSPQDGENGQSSGLQDDKPRLTEEEKKQNHIASEQKRREAIRAGFDRLCALVPGLAGHGRSEGYVLKETVKYMREQLGRRRELVEEAEAKGITVPDHLKEQATFFFFFPRPQIDHHTNWFSRPVKILERLEARQKELQKVHGVHDLDDDS